MFALPKETVIFKVKVHRKIKNTYFSSCSAVYNPNTRIHVGSVSVSANHRYAETLHVFMSQLLSFFRLSTLSSCSGLVLVHKTVRVKKRSSVGFKYLLCLPKHMAGNVLVSP